MVKVADAVVPVATFRPAGVEVTRSPPRPVAVRVSVAVAGAAPQTLATPPPPQVWGAVQTPQVRVPPQPSRMVPQFLPWAAQVVGTQAGGGVLASVPAQRVWWSTPPTVQLMRRSTALPAAGLPLTRKWSAEARRSGTAWAANVVSVPVPEMPPTLIAAPAHPTGKRAGSMLVRLTRVRVPSVRASPTDGKPARLGSSP